MEAATFGVEKPTVRLAKGNAKSQGRRMVAKD
jgi:hypothetical protein